MAIVREKSGHQVDDGWFKAPLETAVDFLRRFSYGEHEPLCI